MSAPRISQELARRLVHSMLLIRRVEERIQAVYDRGEMRSPPHLYMGHEAIASGVCAALRGDDVVYPYYRSHGWYLAKGGDLDEMLAELHGRATGCSRGWGGSMHLIDLAAGVMGTSAIVTGTLSHAAGAALAFRLQGKSSVVAVSFGDGASEEGIFQETLNFSALHRLPVVFVCENNQFATNAHISERQALPGVHHHAGRFGMPGVLVDGNDAVAVHAAAAAAAERARAGGGPTLIECETYRIFEHCGIHEDHELGHRTKADVEAWKAKDPLEKARALVTEAERAAMLGEIEPRIDRAFEFARSSPWPTFDFSRENTN